MPGSSITPGRAGARDDAPVPAQRLPVYFTPCCYLRYEASPGRQPYGMRTARTFSLIHVKLEVVLETALRVRDVRSR
jgi:hypothetical protein